MDVFEKCKKGDVVRFTSDYYGNLDVFMPEFQRLKRDADDISKALSQVEAVITDFWSKGVWVTYRLFDEQVSTNHFFWEVELTGETRIFNDPTRYARPLFEFSDGGAYTQNEATKQWMRQDESRSFRAYNMAHFNHWQEWLTVDEQRLYLSVLDNECAAIIWGNDIKRTTLHNLHKIARERFELMSPDNEELA